MVLIKPSVGAAVITFPDIKDVIQEILLRWYSDVKATQYAADVQKFFEENAKFPEDDIYKLENRVFYRLNVQKSTWDKTKNTKTSYVINDKNAKFWEAFDKRFPYLMDYRAEIQQIIQNTTSAMFDVAMVKTSFVSRDADGVFAVRMNEDSAIKAAIKEYVNPKEQEAYIVKILTEAFHLDTMPIFMIDKGVTVAAITKDTISTDVDDKAIYDLLKKSFSADDAKHLKIVIVNAIKYSVNSEDKILINEHGEIVVNVGGLHIIPIEGDDKNCFIANDSNNSKLFSKLFDEQIDEVIDYYDKTLLYFKDGYAPADKPRKYKKADTWWEGMLSYRYHVEYQGITNTVKFEFWINSSNEICIESVRVAYRQDGIVKIKKNFSGAKATISKS